METIRSETDGGVVTLTLARADRLNALTREVFAELQHAITDAIDNGARALVLTGEGRAFCAGADLKESIAPKDGHLPDLAAEIDESYNPFIRRLMGLAIPVVTAINGPAVGAGLSLALAGDIAVAAESAYFQLAFVNIGLVPDAGATWLVTKSIGRARALEMALLGERMDAAEAQRIGLVNRTVPDGEVLGCAQAIAAKLAAGPGVSLDHIRKQVNFAVDADLADVLERERDNQRYCGYTEDFVEAVTAFGQKRAPVFKGR